MADDNSILCEGAFWDWDAFWNSSNGQLTHCFRQTALVWLPCLYLWALTLYKGVRCWPLPEHQKNCASPWTLLNICKLVLSSVLVVCCLTEGIYLLRYDRLPSCTVDRADYASVCVRLATFVLALWLQVKQKRDGQLNSYVLTVFWTLSTVFHIVSSSFYDLITGALDERTDPVLFVTSSIEFSVVFGQAGFSLFSDPAYSYLFHKSTDEYLREHQTLPSRLLFSWINRLIRYGYRNAIQVENLDPLSPYLGTTREHQKFHEQWSKEEKRAKTKQDGACRRNPSLAIALWKAIWPSLLMAGFLELLYDILFLLSPILLDLLIGFVDSPSEPTWHGYLYAFLLFFAAVASTLLQHHNQDCLIRGSVLPRSGLKAAIYRKVLRLSSGSRRQYTMGELCNLADVDSQRIFELVWSINHLWSYPLRIALTIALLWQYLGAACLAGMAIMLLLMPTTGLLAVHVHRIQKTQMERKDSRLRQMSEILNGIKVLKLFAWEQPFMERVGDVRQSEAGAIKKLAFLNGTVVFLWISAPFLIAVSSFVTYVLMDDRNVLDPSIAFVSLTLFNKLRSSMAAVPQVLAEVVQSRIAFKRVTDFLLSDEIKPDAVGSDTTVGNAVEIDGGSFGWEAGAAPFLRDVTMSVPRGSLAAVVGRVGAGKSALLSALLGEMVKCRGAIRVMKDIRTAYVAQQAWIQNASLRQNVLFVRPMDRKKYEAALKRCSLEQDLQSLPDGDLTEIGEKGVNLSGGQKQRVSLARALYQDADLYLLDDPLSAVDSHVGNHIFKYVIGPNGALKNKTRILVTHNLSVLPEVDQIFLMSEGRILESGTYDQLMDKRGEFFDLIEEYKKDQAEAEKEDEGGEQEAKSVSLSRQNSDDVSELKAQMVLTGSRQLSRSLSRQLSHPPDEPKDKPKKARTLIEKEKVETGSVKANVFWTYIRNASLPLTLFTLLGFVAYQSFEAGSNVWLGAWSSDEPLPDGSQDIPLRNKRMIVYAVLGIAQGLSALLASLVLAVGSTRASIRFHRAMLWSVLRSPMSFFDTTPIGRILNRFGKDINTVDVAVPPSLSNVMTVAVSAIGAVVIICVNHPIFLLILVPLGVIYLFLQFFYMATSRQLRRLHSVTLSPVLSFFSETAAGTSTVRAFGAEFTFVDRQDKLLDTNCVVFLNTTLVNRWLGIRLQLMGGAIVLIAALLTVAQRGTSSAALVGLTLTYALSVTDILATMVRQLTQLETRMVSVERIKEYSSLPSEAPWETGCQLSLESWPREGAITLRDYKMRYRMNTELILKGVSVHIPAGQKVGLVGRTGAGKSSLALALFRIVEPDEGVLLIDGVDVAMLGLHDLRARITVIPQDPVMFSGNLRLNLDPLNQHSDRELWSAIEHAHLKDFIGGLDGGLAFPVAEGGQNLSVGQRQQLCLARALLKKTKILVLDEATAAVDMATDKLIQGSIRREFADCTVITIAHRLYTVLDYDRILIMDDGKIAEDGAPDELLQRPDSLFRQLGKAAGLL